MPSGAVRQRALPTSTCSLSESPVFHRLTHHGQSSRSMGHRLPSAGSAYATHLPLKHLLPARQSPPSLPPKRQTVNLASRTRRRAVFRAVISPYMRQTFKNKSPGGIKMNPHMLMAAAMPARRRLRRPGPARNSIRSQPSRMAARFGAAAAPTIVARISGTTAFSTTRPVRVGREPARRRRPCSFNEGFAANLAPKRLHARRPDLRARSSRPIMTKNCASTPS